MAIVMFHKALDNYFISVVMLTLLLLLLGHTPEGASGLFIREAMKRSASQDINDAEQIRITNLAPERSHRVKRVANILKMPSHLHLRLGGKNKNSKGSIFLQKVSSSISDEPIDFPVFKIGKNGPVRVRIPTNLVLPRAFYRQMNHTGLIMASKITSSFGFALDGTLTIGNKEYVIAPDHIQDDTGSSHILRVVNNTAVAEEEVTDEVIYLNKKEQALSFPSLAGKVNKLFPRTKKEKRYIELAMVADYAAFQKFLDFTGSRPLLTLLEMYLYYGFVSLSASLRYETIKNNQPNLEVYVSPKSLYVCMFRRFCPWSEGHVIKGTNKIEFGKALSSFRKYVNTEKGPDGDHQILFTGYKLARSNGKTGVIGVAYLGTGCGTWGVSIVQEFYTSVTSAIAAHELGHSFSAKHDTDEKSTGCTNSDFYVMAAYLGFPTGSGKSQHPYSFSNCSAKYISDHLASGKGECTKNKPGLSIKTQFIAGQYFNADTQCAFAKGEGSIFCRSYQELRKFDNMCIRTYCSNPKLPPSCTGIVPLHRTSCGDMKWCERGRCVKNIDAPATPHDRCPQGDDPSIPCSHSLCTTETYINILCCETCDGYTPPTTTPTPSTTKYPPSCGKVCQCFIETETLLCFIKCVSGVPC